MTFNTHELELLAILIENDIKSYRWAVEHFGRRRWHQTNPSAQKQFEVALSIKAKLEKKKCAT